MIANPRVMPQPRSSPRIFALAEGDLGEVARFIAKQSGREADAVQAHLRWFLLENPARLPRHPLGFGLCCESELVGCILCCPQVFRFQKKPIELMGSSSFYVDEQHRGWGGRIFLSYCRLAATWPLFGTSANLAAAGLWKAAGASPVPYSDGELLGVLRWPPVVEEIVHRRHSSPVLVRLARGPASNIAGLLSSLKIGRHADDDLRPLSSAEEAAALCNHDFVPRLTAERDLPYIRWRYFSGRDETTQMFAFRSRRPDREVLVAVNQRLRGYRGQINTLNLLDVYPEVGPDEHLRIVAQLIRRYGKAVDAVVLRNQDEAQRTSYRAKGFRWRTFEAPIGWFLDRSRQLDTRNWYAVPADGDGLI